MVRTERESDDRRREMADCWCCRDQLRACTMAQASAEELEHTKPAEKERVASVPQREQLAKTPEPPLPKGKGTEPSVQSARSRRGRESRWARAPLWREMGDQSESMEWKGGLHGERRQIPTRQGEQATRASLEEVEGSMSG